MNLPFLLCFTLYLGAIFQVQAPVGLIFGGAIEPRVFCVTGLGSLYLEGLLHGGAYFWNFTVFSLGASSLGAVLTRGTQLNVSSGEETAILKNKGNTFCLSYLAGGTSELFGAS